LQREVIFCELQLRLALAYLLLLLVKLLKNLLSIFVQASLLRQLLLEPLYLVVFLSLRRQVLSLS